MESYEYIVIGAGIEGSAAAYHLAKNGFKTVLLEQYQLGHSHGSSHGGSRIFRKSYGKSLYTKMTIDGEPMWRELERECGKELLKKVGMLLMAPEESGVVRDYKAIIDSFGLPSQLLTNGQIHERYPQLRVPDTWKVLFEPDAGFFYADKCLQAYHDLFQKHGGTIRSNAKVTKLLPKQTSVDVRTENGLRYTSRSVVLCLGGWTGNFVKTHFNLSLPLQPVSVATCFWKETQLGAYSADNNFPTGWVRTEKDCEYFFLPAAEFPGLVKVCYSHGPTVIDPDDNSRSKGDSPSLQESVDCASNFVRSHFPLADPEKPAVVQPCIFTFTPDNHVILDRLPAYQNVVIGAGFSGHGFKLAPVIGKILATMAAESANRIMSNKSVCGYDLSETRIDRFSSGTLTGIRHMM